MTERTGCVVAGGGPAGMVLGLLLARAGVEVTVLEKHGDFLRDFRGDTVHPSTLRLIDDLGLGEKFAALPQSRISEVAFPDEEGSRVVLADLNRLRTPHPYVAMVPQWDLLDLLAEAARAEPGFTLRMNTEVTDVTKESGRVTGVAYRETGGKTGEIRADLVVACDGRWSLLRRQSGLLSREFPVPMDAWWFRLPTDSSPQPALTPSLTGRHLAVGIPREGYLQVAYMAPKGIDAQLRAEGIEAFRQRIASVLPQYAEKTEGIKSMDDVKHLDVRLDRLRRWYVDGLLCIGDAAHAMSPIGGVGINLAVQDAVATAELLAWPLRQGRVTTADLAKVQRRRMLPTVMVQGLQRLMHRTIIKPALEGRRAGMPKPLVRLLRTFPAASHIPAYLIGIGFRPESAPSFARRP